MMIVTVDLIVFMPLIMIGKYNLLELTLIASLLCFSSTSEGTLL